MVMSKVNSFSVHFSLLFNLLYHDAVGASELQASGEVKSVHPAQDKCKHHHRHIGLDARQVESSGDYNQYRIDEAREDRQKVCQGISSKVKVCDTEVIHEGRKM